MHDVITSFPFRQKQIPGIELKIKPLFIHRTVRVVIMLEFLRIRIIYVTGYERTRLPRRITPWHTGALCVVHALTSVITRGNVKL